MDKRLNGRKTLTEVSPRAKTPIASSHVEQTSSSDYMIYSGLLLTISAGIILGPVAAAAAAGKLATDAAAGAAVYGLITGTFSFAAGTGLLAVGTTDKVSNMMLGVETEHGNGLGHHAQLLEEFGSIEKMVLGNSAGAISEKMEPGSGHLVKALSDVAFDAFEISRIGQTVLNPKTASKFELIGSAVKSIQSTRDIIKDTRRLDEASKGYMSPEIKAPKPSGGGGGGRPSSKM